MKKFLFCSAAAVALLATSCSSDMPEPVANDGNSTFTINLPASFTTRSFGDGKTTDVIKYAVYDANSTDPENLDLIMEGNYYFTEEEPNHTKVPILLPNGKAYKIVFFASHGDKMTNGVPYGFDAENHLITVNYDHMGYTDEEYYDEGKGEWIYNRIPNYNQYDYDAFLGTYETDGIVTGPIEGEVTLHRIMAQVNWGSSDINIEATNAIYGQNAENLWTKVVYKDVFTQYNFLTGEVGEPITVTFDYCKRPTERFPGDFYSYGYASMAYLLVPTDGKTIDAVFTPSIKGETEFTPVEVFSIPVQANYRTNICGALLTSNADITVNKDPWTWYGGFNYPDNNEEGDNNEEEDY